MSTSPRASPRSPSEHDGGQLTLDDELAALDGVSWHDWFMSLPKTGPSKADQSEEGEA